MEIILLERIARLGAIGDVVKVKNGYARNFLIPLKKALRASDANKKVFEERRHIIEEQNAKAKAEAEAIAGKFAGLTLTLTRQASQEGKLYGSIGVRDVVDALKEAGHEVQKSQLVMSGAIKNTGTHSVRITLHPDVVVTISVDVQKLESEAA
ncbi:MAG: 50S ribosomal protein L9 [Alphaproteobacteria bacterium]|nr:50S ribosomal protein L9 [Alphaproteobacteria bacterium]